MLVLNRKLGESLIIDDEIEIRVLEVSDGKVKIGIVAPNDVKIFRKEVYEEIKEENKKAVVVSFDSFSKLKGPLK